MENGNETSCTKAEVVVPHDHDVLSGRGNFVNYHAGNEHFRALVRKHKVAYLACPKPQKGQFSRMIVDEMRLLDPPGRFLKQDKVTQLWYDIGDKKALDKTRQALREGAPDLMKNLVNSDEDDDEDEPTQNDLYLDFQRQPQPQFGIDDNPCNNMGGLQALMPPPDIVSSGSAMGGLHSVSYQNSIGQQRVIPGMINLPSDLDASLNTATRMQPLSAGSMYNSESFEPTPIHPNLQLKGRDFDPTTKSQGVVTARCIERSDSLTFETVFVKDQDSTSKTARMGLNSSNHLSAMSFSIGDMSDGTNLSAVFEDSLRISDEPPSRVLSSSKDYTKKSAISPHGTSAAGERKQGSMNVSAQMDMSTQTFGTDESNLGTTSLGSSIYNMSFLSKD